MDTDPPSDDGRLRFRYDFRLKSAPPNPSTPSAVAETPFKQELPPLIILALPATSPPPPSVDQPRTLAPASITATPRRHPSRVRISAVRNFPNALAHKRKRDEPDDFLVTDFLVTPADRQKVRDAVSEFESVYTKLLNDASSGSSNPDMQAFKIFNEKYKYVNNKRYVGFVPGIEVGDAFNLRVELCVVGLHRQQRLAVDFTNEDGKNVAVSIVYSRDYAEGMKGHDVFDYSSVGDLKHEGNLALKNSMDTGTPVRVIHGFRGYQSSSNRVTKEKRRVITYVYDGVFFVDKYWRRKGSDGAYVCMFQFKRMTGQSELVLKPIKTPEGVKHVYVDYDKHVIVKDISGGVEKIPIPVVNAIDDQHPMPFKYTTKMIYLPHNIPSPPRGCDCIDGCSDSERCACAVKNGGELPFNEKGDLVEAKPLVYECGPSCKCPPSCHNRVSQRGIKFRLEIFKTELRGWGVRPRERIPSGSFICEYAGTLVDDREADYRANDEYLFDIGNNYYDEALWEGLKTSIPDLKKGAPGEDEEVFFAVDALEFGNVGRFVNHSCTPNLYAQNLLYDHDDMKMPHIALFATDDILPMQELTYDYNYAIDQVRDSDGNLKMKNCYCGSIECTGRMY